MVSNPIGRNSKHLGVNVPKWMDEELARRAQAMGISKSKYASRVLANWLASRTPLIMTDGDPAVMEAKPPAYGSPEPGDKKKNTTRP
jgi:hypothetical protein